VDLAKKTIKTILVTTILLTLGIQTTIASYSIIPNLEAQREFHEQLKPEETKTEEVKIKNNNKTPLKINLYSVDATHSNQGTFALKAKYQDQLHIGKWIKFENNPYTIPPNTEITIPFTIQIPKNTPPGAYAGGIAAEAITDNNTHTTVSISTRQIIKLFINIPGKITTKYTWENFKYIPPTKENKYPQFSFSIKNEGNSIIIIEPTITIKGFPFPKTNKITMPQITLQPKSELKNIQARWNDYPSWGIYNATATITISKLDIATNKKTQTKILTKNIYPINRTPTSIIIFLALLITGLITFFIYNKINQQNLIKICKPYKVQENETLITIAKKYNVKWKRLAKINKIKPPYTLKEGKKIQVPIKHKKTNPKK